MSRESAGETGRSPVPEGERPSFETALHRLEEIVHRLERGEITLDESLSAFREGSELVRFCLERLTAAEKAVQQLMVADNGALALKTASLEEESAGDAPDA
jgi:exodeoxyribonuclease VII small subunit